MRYTRVGNISYLVTAVLFAAALLFAAWRAPRASVSETSPDAAGTPGLEGYRGACASCHPDPAQLVSAFAFPGGAQAIARLLIVGEARLVKDGTKRVVRRHPTFEGLPDERLAAIVNHLATLRRAPGQTSPEIVTPKDFRVLRPR